MVFLSQKVDGNMIFTDYWKVLVLIFLGIRNKVFSWAKKLMERWYLLITEKVLFWTFRWWEIRSFFESRSWWKDDIYWLLRSSCFELFDDGKYGLFFSQNVDGKMIYTSPFWAFHDIPGPGKYGFSRSVKRINEYISTPICCPFLYQLCCPSATVVQKSGTYSNWNTLMPIPLLLEISEALGPRTVWWFLDNVIV